MRGLFVTGTGTGVGKTVVTAGIVRVLREHGRDAVPMKPFQTGCEADADGRLHAPDLTFALSVSGCLPAAGERSDLCPFAFEPACSPHLAARMAGVSPDLDLVEAAVGRIAQRREIIVAEGAGGLLVPLNPQATMADLAVRLGWPVLVVARSGLGTINETLLTLEALAARALCCAGVVMCDTMQQRDGDFIRRDNPAAIEQYGSTRVLARVPWLGRELTRADAAWQRFSEAFDPPIQTWEVWS